MTTVRCGRCRALVPQSESVFSTNGGVLCRACGVQEEAHAQVDRAVAASQAAQSSQGAHHHDHVRPLSAAAEHAALERIERREQVEPGRAMARGEASVRCARCSRVVPQSDATYDTAGASLCSACGAGFDVAAVQRDQADSQFWRALVPTLLFGAVAVIYWLIMRH